MNKLRFLKKDFIKITSKIGNIMTTPGSPDQAQVNFLGPGTLGLFANPFTYLIPIGFSSVVGRGFGR